MHRSSRLDASYRNVRTRVPRPSRTPRRSLGWVIILLVAANIAVIVYHGDPRELFVPPARAASSSDASDVAPSSTPAIGAVGAASSTPAQPSAAALGSEPVPGEILPDGSVAPFDPTLGLRSPGPIHRVAVTSLRSGQTVPAALSAAGVASEAAAAAIASLAPFVDFRRLRPSDKVIARFDAADKLLGLEIARGPTERAAARLEEGVWVAGKIDVQVQSAIQEVSGSIDSSLWDALLAAGEDARLVTEMVDIFAWDVDFYSEVFRGDTFRLLVEKRYVDGEFVGYGTVRAAEYVSAGHAHRAFLHQDPEGRVAYFDVNGESLQKQLLKAPLKYAPVTSRFGSRQHPVLGYTRAHNGVDYGVPTGTPVWAVGDGRVVHAGMKGGFGKVVEIKHANGWLSQYAHLSKINVSPGERVRQKDIIGAVGSTGLSTGPHLHYGLKRDSSYVNPLTQKFERGRSLAGGELEGFKARVADLARDLDNIRVAERTKRSRDEG